MSCKRPARAAIAAVDPCQRGGRAQRIRLRRLLRTRVPRAQCPEPMATNPYLVFLLYLVAILGFVAFTLLLNRVLGPKPKATAAKLEPFECGAQPVDPVNVRAMPIKYYAVALAF